MGIEKPDPPRRWRALGGLWGLVWSIVALLGAACSSPAGYELTAPDQRSNSGLPPEAAEEGQVLVRLASGVEITAINRRYDTRTIANLASEPIFLLRIPEGQTLEEYLPKMARDPALQVAEPNYRIQNPEADRGSSMTFADPSLGGTAYVDQEAITRIRASEARGFAPGSGVIVAVMDTGVDASHPLLSGRVTAGGADFVDGDSDPSDTADRVDSDGNGLFDQALGHGTFVAGLVLSVAPQAYILPIRVLNSDGVGTAFNVARGIELARSRGAGVINMSFGMFPPSRVVTDLIRELRDQGIGVVASAGNHDTDVKQFPAADAFVIGVAATDSLDRKAEFSNFGSWVGISAPGVGLISLFPGRGFAVWSGTSFAAALVSGEAAALISAKPFARFDDVEDAIRLSATPIDALNPYYRGKLGSGRIDALAALRQIRCECEPPEKHFIGASPRLSHSRRLGCHRLPARVFQTGCHESPSAAHCIASFARILYGCSTPAKG